MLTVDSVVASARRREELDDLGDPVFVEPLGALLDAYAAADLSETGSRILRGNVVQSLRMRLRTVEWLRRHPEIADEVIAAPVVVVGMMRSGTTLLQRLLAADDRFTCALGWEVQEPAPPLTGPDERLAAALAREEQMRTWAPDLFAIHPMYAQEAEEEIVFLSDAFLSHVPEAYAHVPTYRSWIDDQSFAPAYTWLKLVLQLLQWHKKQRGERVGRWVLKTPAHLGYLPELLAAFPDLHLVHMHRDPRDTIASGASLNATLHAMHMASFGPGVVGAEWLERMGWTNDRALAARDRLPATDIEFSDAVADPVGQVARVYAAVGLDLTADAEAAMRHWLEVRPRETARPSYCLEDYGLTPAQVDERFAAYNERFRA
ncbi:MAG: hypothetical protein JWO22_681 [Frankiales bacterium]|nr:hypothetical protein [Frankiales bacterium]